MSDKISVFEISKHASTDDCWLVINGKVYDFTNFAPNHPGGATSEFHERDHAYGYPDTDGCQPGCQP